jgi:integrase
MTVAQLMDEYVKLYGMNHWSEGTLSCNLHRINHYILPYIGAIPIKTLTTHRLEQFYRKLQTQPATKTKGHENEDRCISPSVIEKVHNLIRSALNQAVRWDYLRGNNPALAVELPRYKKETRSAWSAQEAQQALALCDDPILKLCMYLALGCSMRIGEILGLTWDCVHLETDLTDQDSPSLTVEKELRRCDKQCIKDLEAQGRSDVFYIFPEWKQTGCSTSLVLKTPKTESSVRTIYIPQTIVAALQAAKELQESCKVDLGPIYQDYNLVIAQNNGRPYEATIISQKLRSLIKKHNLKPVVFHSLRHSSASLKLKVSGGDIKSVQRDTGHSQSRMVTDVYSHSFDEDRRHLSRKMDEMFFSQGSLHEEDSAQPSDSSVQALRKLVDKLKENPEKIASLSLLLDL